MADIKIIVISSVRPEPTSGGQLTLYRHLIEQAGIAVEIYGNEPDKLTPSAAIRRLFGRMQRTRLRRFAEDFWTAWAGRWLDEMLPGRIESKENTVVVTVAHGDACMAALRFAQKYKLPLVTFFHDWWPHIPDVHAPFHRRLEMNFKQLYRGSAVALCVCEGMNAALGKHPCAPVLYPIPKNSNGNIANAMPSTDAKTSFKIYCSGNLNEYGPMLGEALKLFTGHKSIHLEVRGANPNWPTDFREAMRARGLWKDFIPRNELDAWLTEADAFLIPMVFDAKLRRRMETSFPSKLIEFAQLGKPLVVWGPEYCSAVKWARHGNRALCVTDANPSALSKALDDLASSPDKQQRLADVAQQAARTDFNPELIQMQFMQLLCKSAKITN